MASADVIRRLELVAQRLEAYANNLPSGGGASSGGRARESKESPAVAAYQAYYEASVVPFINTVKAVKETAYIVCYFINPIDTNNIFFCYAFVFQ
jgi:hypothetical protein